MNRTQALRHIFHVIERTKTTINWQIVARVVLISLYLDGRMTTKLRDEIDQLITSGELLNEDHLIQRI